MKNEANTQFYRELKMTYFNILRKYKSNLQLARFYFTLHLIRNFPRAENKVISKVVQVSSNDVRRELNITNKKNDKDIIEVVNLPKFEESKPVNVTDCRRALQRLLKKHVTVVEAEEDKEDYKQINQALDELERLREQIRMLVR